MYPGLRTKVFRHANEDTLHTMSVEEWANPGSEMTMIYSTGYTGQPLTLYKDAQRRVSFERGLSISPSLMSVHAGGTATFGNDTAIASIQASVDGLTAAGRSGPYMLWGGSMGFLDLMNWARLNPTRVVGAICMMGLVDLNHVYNSNLELSTGVFAQALINTAYGGTYDPLTMGPTRNPRQFMGSMPFPIHAFYSDDDPLIPASMIQEATTNIANFNSTSVGNYGHYEPAQEQAGLHPNFTIFINQMKDEWRARVS